VTRRGPDFVIVGAPKCGTTSLFHYLSQHPQVYAPSRKEPHYYCHAFPPGFPPMDEAAYYDLFQGASEEQLAFEASTNYLYSAAACARMRDELRNARVVITIRNPTDRAYAEYWHYRRHGLEPLSFEQCIDADGERQEWRRYVRRGLYSAHIQRYQEAFGDERVHVLLLDDLQRDARQACADIFAFLSIDTAARVDASGAHGEGGRPRWPWAAWLHRELIGDTPPWLRAAARVGPRWLRRAVRHTAKEMLTSRATPAMEAETRIRLSRAYATEIEQLQMLLSRDLLCWRQ